MTDNCNLRVPNSPSRSIRLNDGIKKRGDFDDNWLTRIVSLCQMNFKITRDWLQ